MVTGNVCFNSLQSIPFPPPKTSIQAEKPPVNTLLIAGTAASGPGVVAKAELTPAGVNKPDGAFKEVVVQPLKLPVSISIFVQDACVELGFDDLLDVVEFEDSMRLANSERNNFSFLSNKSKYSINSFKCFVYKLL